MPDLRTCIVYLAEIWDGLPAGIVRSQLGKSQHHALGATTRRGSSRELQAIRKQDTDEMHQLIAALPNSYPDLIHSKTSTMTLSCLMC